MKRVLPLFLILGTLAVSPSPAGAGDMLRVVRPSTGGQVNATRPIAFPLAPGYGVTISFARAGQTIKKVWVANVAWMLVSADGCLEGLGTKDCKDGEGARILHLRRVNDLDIRGLPNTPRTTVTVIVEGTGGTGIYVFEPYKSARPGRMVFEVAPLPTPTDAVTTPAPLSPARERPERTGRRVSSSGGGI
jgi:hypothetical protein